MSIIDSISKIVKDSFGKKEKSVVAIDFGISSIKVVQLRNEKGTAVLETYGELACGPYGGLAVGQSSNLPPEKTFELLTDLFREANITAKAGAIAIPSRTSLIVSIDIPEMDEKKLAEVVPMEARKYVPVPIAEVILDWWVVPKNAQETEIDRAKKEEAVGSDPKLGKKMEVLIASIHNDVIRAYQDLNQKLGLSVDSFEIETFSAIRAVMPNDLSATVIFDIGAGTSKISIVDYGIVRLSHTINKGSQDMTISISKSLNIPFDKAEEIKRRYGLMGDVEKGDLVESISPTVEYIFAEANKVMMTYQRERSRAVDKMILIGGGALLKGILETAKSIVSVPVVIGLPFDKVETPAFLNNVLKEAGPEFAVAIGLALRKLEDL
ncbi:MAG: type IV pilus assembly protein PilM [Candidatus Vogelbacteria bacterium]|nr:type IV pilus assembly protein PilM [Candidatus Vogelbacteria bacterium]